MKVKEWLPVWLENYVKPTAKEKTYTRYSDVVTHHLIPRIRGIGDVVDHATDATTDGNGTFRAWQSSDRRRGVRQYGEHDRHGDTSRFADGVSPRLSSEIYCR